MHRILKHGVQRDCSMLQDFWATLTCSGAFLAGSCIQVFEALRLGSKDAIECTIYILV